MKHGVTVVLGDITPFKAFTNQQHDETEPEAENKTIITFKAFTNQQHDETIK